MMGIVPHNNAMQTDKAKLSRLLLAQKLRQFGFAADRERWALLRDSVMPRTSVYVRAVVMQNDRILLVRQSSGHPLEGQWTVPWGRIEEGESPADAAVRETWEEGGVRAEIEGLLGVQELPHPQEGGIALVYMCRHTEGNPDPQDRETDAARYFSQEELEEWNEPLEPWSAWLARRVFAQQFTLVHPAPTNPLRPEGAFL